MAHTYTYIPSRLAAYFLLWFVSLVLMGLTAYRIHFTESVSLRRSYYDPIIVELLVSSILGIIWVPVAVVLLMGEDADNTYRTSTVRARRLPRRVVAEMIGLFILWLMWLVGAAITTNQIIPGRNYCARFTVFLKECNTLTSILVFAWIGWSLLTIAGVLCLMHLSSAMTASSMPLAQVKEKSEPLSQPGNAHEAAGTAAPAAQPDAPN
ncbi:hypothetical protein CPB85DRAFT_766533 [Mucidula mucida]|nr:hypothetical protein CPB85DRAFT_766533 [Mucidula mucida]